MRYLAKARKAREPQYEQLYTEIMTALSRHEAAGGTKSGPWLGGMHTSDDGGRRDNSKTDVEADA